jgi:hypothetical protein
MTLLGKLLLLFNLAFGLLLATWAFNFYANGIDWTDRADKGVPVGEFAIRAAKLEELWKGAAPAQAEWLTERGQLSKTENRLVTERVWYDKEIRYVWFGPAKGKGVFEVASADKDDPKTGVKKGQILLDDEGNPKLKQPLDAKGNPLLLLSLAEYNKEDDDTLQMLKDVIAKHVKQIDEAIKWTDLIIGDKAKGIRGYHDRIADEQAKNVELLAEIKLVRPRYINTMVEAQLINKRHEQMIKRVEELKKLKVASK